MKKTCCLQILLMVVFAALFLQGCSAGEGARLHGGLEVRGTVEAKEVDINTKLPGKIAKLNVKEGQHVEAGEVIAVMENNDLLAKKAQAEAKVAAAKKQVEMADAAVGAARANLLKAQNGARSQEIQEAEAYYELTQKTYERVKSLYEKGGVPAQKLDEALTQMNIAKEKLAMAREGARYEDIMAAQAVANQADAALGAAQAQYEQALAGVQEVQSYLDDTMIKAPIAGTITELNVEEGELVSTGMPIATVKNLDDIWVKVNVSEQDLPKVQEGANVTIRTLSYPDRLFQGEVTAVNQNPDFAVKRATNDNGGQDIVTFEVKITFLEGKELMRPGMTAFVRFE